jgi:quercetin dioxygenase-like cupin family protein
VVAEMVLETGLVAGEQETVWIQGLSARVLLGGERTEGRCAVVEHTILPRSLGAPLHTHADEDEISFVIEGQVGVQIGDEVTIAGPGAVVFKPRGVPHAFWNAGDGTVRLLELITPGGFEGYFTEAAAMFAATCPPDPATAGAIMGRYRLQMDVESIPVLMQAHGLIG